MEPLHIHNNANPSIEVDPQKFPAAQNLINRCKDFFEEIQNMTPGYKLEAYLNEHYNPSTQIYKDLYSLTLQGLEQGWVANIEITGPKYRRSKIQLPKEETSFLSITTVYMESTEEMRGQYHSHPYGEINCVIPIDEGAQLKGLNGWQGKGWTSPGPGTHHFPEVRGGALISLFFLPAGRISYDAKPGDPQPSSL